MDGAWLQSVNNRLSNPGGRIVFFYTAEPGVRTAGTSPAVPVVEEVDNVVNISRLVLGFSVLGCVSPTGFSPMGTAGAFAGSQPRQVPYRPLIVMASSTGDVSRSPEGHPVSRATVNLKNIPSIPRLMNRLRSRWALRSAARMRSAGGDVRRSHRVFRLNGLRWHHMAIARDLQRFAAYAESVDCAGVTPERLAELEGIFGFFVDKVWMTYNRLERDAFFPWVLEGGAGGNGFANVARAIDAFGSERDRIEGSATQLRGRLERMTRKGRARNSVLRSAGHCSTEMRRIVGDVETLLEDVTRLHQTEEDILFPYITRQFTKDQQRHITYKIIDLMDKPLAKLNLVSFHEALKTTAATRADWRAYENEVPAPARLYLWVWRGRYWEPSPLAILDPSVTNSKRSSGRASDDGSPQDPKAGKAARRASSARKEKLRERR